MICSWLPFRTLPKSTGRNCGFLLTRAATVNLDTASTHQNGPPCARSIAGVQLPLLAACCGCGRFLRCIQLWTDEVVLRHPIHHWCAGVLKIQETTQGVVHQNESLQRKGSARMHQRCDYHSGRGGIRFHPYRSELQPLARVNERHRRTPSIPCAQVVAVFVTLTGQAIVTHAHHRPGHLLTLG